MLFVSDVKQDSIVVTDTDDWVTGGISCFLLVI